MTLLIFGLLVLLASEPLWLVGFGLDINEKILMGAFVMLTIGTTICCIGLIVEVIRMIAL